MFRDGLSPEQHEVRRKARAVVERVRAAFRSLPLDRECEAYRDAKFLVEVEFPTWEELFRLEILTLRAATPVGRATLALSIDEQFSRLPAPREPDAEPAKPSAESGTTSDRDQELERLIFRLREVQWDMRKGIELESALEKLRWTVGGIATTLAVGILLAAYHWRDCGLWSVSLWAMFFGTCGAAVSLFFRMSSASKWEAEDRDYTPYKRVAMLLGPNADIAFSLVSGPIFALVLVQLFAAGLMPGGVAEGKASGLFPNFDGIGCTNGSAVPVWCCIDRNLGSLAVWSFIGGLAERFVPDVLNRLTGNGKANARPSDLKK